MASPLMKLVVALGLESKEFTQGLTEAEKKAESSTGKITKGLSNIGGAVVLGGIAAAGAGVAALGGVLASSVKVAGEWEVTVSKLEAVQTSMGQKTGFTTDELLAQAGALQQVTRFGDDMIVTGQTILATFSNIGGEVFERTTELALDLAEVFGQSIPGAATMLGKALDDPVAGMSALKRVGVSLNEEQIKMITKMQESGDMIGAQTALLEVLESQVGGAARAVGETFSGQVDIAKNALGDMQKVIGGELLPVLTDLGKEFNAWLSDPVVQESLQNIAEKIADLGRRAVEFIPVAIDWFKQAFDFLKNNEGIVIGVLAALGVAVGVFVYSVVIPAAISMIATLLPIILVMAAIAAVVYLAYNAWKSNWGGIRDIVTSVWEGKLKPIFDRLVAWLQDFIPKALDTLKKYWEDVLLPAITRVWNWIQGTLIPYLSGVLYPWIKEKLTQAIQALSDFWTDTLLPAITKVWAWISGTLIPFFQNTVFPWLQEKIPAAIQTLSDFWTNTLLPAIEAVWAFIQDPLMPLFKALVDFFDAAFTLALTALAGLWQNVLQPALKTVGDYVGEKLQPVLQALSDFWTDTLGPALTGVKESILDKLPGVFDNIKEKIQWVIDKVNSFTDALKRVKLPEWLTPGSPTPFEWGLRGISSALDDLNKRGLPKFNAELNIQPIGALSAVADDSGSKTYSPTYNFYRLEDDRNVLERVKTLDMAYG